MKAKNPYQIEEVDFYACGACLSVVGLDETCCPMDCYAHPGATVYQITVNVTHAEIASRITIDYLERGRV